MPNQSHRLYRLVRCAIEQTEPLPAVMCRFALVFARHTGDTELAAQLAHRTDLPADVLAALAADPAVEVRLAYLNRPDVPIEERRRLLATEKRAKVLAALAAVADEATLRVLAEHPTRTVQMAVLTAEHAPAETRRRVVFRLVKGPFTLTAEHRDRIRKFIARDTDGHTEYALRLPSEWLRELVPSPHLSGDAVRRLVQLLVVEPAGRLRLLPADPARRRAHEILDVVRKLGPLDRAPEDVLAALCAAVDAAAAHVPPADKILLEARDRLQNRDEQARSRHLAETSEDPAVLAELAADSAVSAVLEAVVRNRAASADTTVTALRRLGNKTRAPRLAADFWSARSGQDDVLFAVAEHLPAMLRHWKPTVADTPLVLRVLRSALVPANEKRALVAGMCRPGPVPDEVVAALPLAVFEFTQDRALLAPAVRYLTERIAALPAELLVRIADDFEDSLEALCAVVAGLATTDEPVAS